MGMSIDGLYPNAYNVMPFVVCVPVTTDASIQAFAIVLLVEFNTILISLVNVTPLTYIVYVYGELYPDQLPLESVIFTFLYLSTLFAKLLFSD